MILVSPKVSFSYNIRSTLHPRTYFKRWRRGEFGRVDFEREAAEKKKKRKRIVGNEWSRWGHGARYWTRRFNSRRRKGGSSGFVSARGRALWQPVAAWNESVETLYPEEF